MATLEDEPSMEEEVSPVEISHSASEQAPETAELADNRAAEIEASLLLDTDKTGLQFDNENYEDFEEDVKGNRTQNDSTGDDVDDLDRTLAELENFEFSEEKKVEDDKTGRLAYVTKSKEFDFFMFPVKSVINKFDNEDLNLAHQGLGDKGTISLAETLKINSTIKKLFLMDNWITPRGGEALMEAFLINSHITRLDLSNNRLGQKGSHPRPFGPLLAEMLRGNTTLKQLSLKGNKLSDRDMIPIADAMCENTSLLILDLSYNELGPRSGEAIKTMLATNGDLKSLNIEWNQLRNQGTVAVLNGLKNNNVLKRMNIAWNGVGDEGGIEIGLVLKSNTSLEIFKANNNNIGKEGARAIAEGIQENMTLKELDISNNPLKEEGAYLIIKALQENQGITTLFMKNSQAGMDEHMNSRNRKRAAASAAGGQSGGKSVSDEEGHEESRLKIALVETLKKRKNLEKILFS